MRNIAILCYTLGSPKMLKHSSSILYSPFIDVYLYCIYCLGVYYTQYAYTVYGTVRISRARALLTTNRRLASVPGLPRSRTRIYLSAWGTTCAPRINYEYKIPFTCSKTCVQPRQMHQNNYVYRYREVTTCKQGVMQTESIVDRMHISILP